MDGFEVRTATLQDVEQLRLLETQAAVLFRSIPELAHFADGGPSMSLQQQADLIQKRSIFIVGDKSFVVSHGFSKPCGFLAADQVDQSLHVFELSVAPDYQGQGFATRLLDTAAHHAEKLGLANLSLTTDRYVPWNGPMYAKRGFEEITASQLGPEHERIVTKEEEDGLDIARRCTMMRKIGASGC